MAESHVLHRASLDSLLESVGGDRAFLIELIDVFLADAPEQFAALRRAIVEGDMDVLWRVAHTLKSNLVSFGALDLAQQCRELEEIGRLGMADTVADRLPSLEAEWDQVRAALVLQRGGT